jgi:hypothetical protein
MERFDETLAPRAIRGAASDLCADCVSSTCSIHSALRFVNAVVEAGSKTRKAGKSRHRSGLSRDASLTS